MLKACTSYFFHEIDHRQFDFCRSYNFKKQRRRILPPRNESKRKIIAIERCVAKLRTDLQKNRALKLKFAPILAKNTQRIGRKWYLGSGFLLSRNLSRNKKLFAKIENTLAPKGIRDSKTSAAISNPIVNDESSTSASTATRTKLLIETLTDALKLSEKYFPDVNRSNINNKSKNDKFTTKSSSSFNGGDRNMVNHSVSYCTTLKDMDETQILFLQSIMFPFNPTTIDTTVSGADFLNSTLFLPSCPVKNGARIAPPSTSDDQNAIIYQEKNTNSTISVDEHEFADQNNDKSPPLDEDDSDDTSSFLSFETENVEFVMDINEKVFALLKNKKRK